MCTGKSTCVDGACEVMTDCLSIELPDSFVGTLEPNSAGWFNATSTTYGFTGSLMLETNVGCDAPDYLYLSTDYVDPDSDWYSAGRHWFWIDVDAGTPHETWYRMPRYQGGGVYIGPTLEFDNAVLVEGATWGQLSDPAHDFPGRRCLVVESAEVTLSDANGCYPDCSDRVCGLEACGYECGTCEGYDYSGTCVANGTQCSY